jgi:hypothetical protein
MANELDELNPSGSSKPAPESRKKSFFGGLAAKINPPSTPGATPSPGYKDLVDQDKEAAARKTFFQ